MQRYDVRDAVGIADHSEPDDAGDVGFGGQTVVDPAESRR